MHVFGDTGVPPLGSERAFNMDRSWFFAESPQSAVLQAVVGLVSATNTFCHIHTPLPVSCMRVVNGAWVGALFGLALIWVLGRFGISRRPGQD